MATSGRLKAVTLKAFLSPGSLKASATSRASSLRLSLIQTDTGLDNTATTGPRLGLGHRLNGALTAEGRLKGREGHTTEEASSLSASCPWAVSDMPRHHGIISAGLAG